MKKWFIKRESVIIITNLAVILPNIYVYLSASSSHNLLKVTTGHRLIKYSLTPNSQLLTPNSFIDVALLRLYNS